MRILCRRAIMTSIAAAVTAALLGGTSLAFEHRGFHSGMTLDEVELKAKSEEILLTPIDGTDSGYTFGSPDSPVRNSLFFCDGLLFLLSAGLMGGVAEFVQSADQYIAVKGNPEVQSTSSFTSGGNLFSQIRLSWTTSSDHDETVELVLTDYLEETSAGVSYSARSVCGNPKSIEHNP